MFCRNKFVVSGYIPQCMKCVVKQKETMQRENTLFQYDIDYYVEYNFKRH